MKLIRLGKFWHGEASGSYVKIHDFIKRDHGEMTLNPKEIGRMAVAKKMRLS